VRARALTFLLVLTFVLPASAFQGGGTLAQDGFSVDATDGVATEAVDEASPTVTEAAAEEATATATATETTAATETVAATETGTAAATATAPETGTPTATESPTEAATETETATEPASGTPTVDQSDAPIANVAAAASPEASPTEEPPALEDVKLTLSCLANAELTRIDNLSADRTLVISSIASTYNPSASEPYVIAPMRTLGPGKTVIYRSNSEATYGTILTTNELYTDSAYDQDGAVIETNAGTITQPCAAAPPPALSEIKVTLACASNPEQTRIDNLSAGSTLIVQSIASLADKAASEPYVVNRSLGAGKTVIYRSGSGATTGTILTTNELYTNAKYDADGAQIVTNAGTITTKCAAAPPPSELSLSMTCNGWPEKTTVKNIGKGPVKLHSLWTSYNKQSFEPIALNATLNPGQSITYQSGGGATSNKLSGTEIYTENAGTAEKLTVKVSTGKTFTKACPPGPKWIEVNLSTQYLTAWEGQTRIAGAYTSTGKDGFWTPTGTFYVNTKLTSQTMAGCIQGECYNVPNVPWVMYFTNVGHAIHGAYWHDEFGIRRRSHGCVNLPVSFAEWLYWWTPIGTRVVIHY
jgi:lipoprotein-anchoring transpeptidase ErfK/SrfK